MGLGSERKVQRLMGREASTVVIRPHSARHVYGIMHNFTPEWAMANIIKYYQGSPPEHWCRIQAGVPIT
jgi:hypothetical protein